MRPRTINAAVAGNNNFRPAHITAGWLDLPRKQVLGSSK